MQVSRQSHRPRPKTKQQIVTLCRTSSPPERKRTDQGALITFQISSHPSTYPRASEEARVLRKSVRTTPTSQMGQSTRTTTLKRSGNGKGEPPQMHDRLPLRSLKNGCEGVLPEEDPFMPQKSITFDLGSELQVQKRDGIECS